MGNKVTCSQVISKVACCQCSHCSNCLSERLEVTYLKNPNTRHPSMCFPPIKVVLFYTVVGVDRICQLINHELILGTQLT